VTLPSVTCPKNHVGQWGMTLIPTIGGKHSLHARVSQHPQAHQERWMVSDQETVFYWV